MIQLIREIGVGIEVPGILYVGGFKIPTLENKHYLFNDGIYTLKMEYSPKFNKHLWEFKDIPGRSEIKFHFGVNVNDTRGCLLFRRSVDLDSLHYNLSSSKTYKIRVRSKKQRLTDKLGNND